MLARLEASNPPMVEWKLFPMRSNFPLPQLPLEHPQPQPRPHSQLRSWKEKGSSPIQLLGLSHLRPLPKG